MQSTDVEVVRTTQVTVASPLRPARRPRGVPLAAWMAAVALLALAAAGAFASQRELHSLTSEVDEKNLERAGLLLARTIAEDSANLLSEVRVLSEDTRVRTTVMTPEFNEATVRDVLEDLRRASGASVMAVLDVRGRVQAVAGQSSLQGMDLGASPLIAQALEKPVANVWTFPGQVLVIGLAAVRAAGQVTALFLVGEEIGESKLASIENALGVAGAVVIRDKMAASSSRSPGLAAAVQMAGSLDEGRSQVVEADRPYLVRVTGVSQSAGAGRVVWLLPMHQYGGRLLKLQILGWMPMVLVCLSLALAISLHRRRATGDGT
jgi:hypothetical protein